jgi:small subunit ribosomal protein S8
MHDPIADYLTQIRNAYAANHSDVSSNYSKVKHEIARILSDAGYVGGIEIVGEKPHQKITLALRYLDGQPLVTHIKRISTPSVRVYSGKTHIPKALSGRGMTVLTTSRGIMSDKEARKLGVGGEVIFQIW